jgi:hypothetical protein
VSFTTIEKKACRQPGSGAPWQDSRPGRASDPAERPRAVAAVVAAGPRRAADRPADPRVPQRLAHYDHDTRRGALSGVMAA